MLVPVRCTTPGCGATYRVPSDRLGHAGRCKRCGIFFALAAEAAPIEDGGPRTTSPDRPPPAEPDPTAAEQDEQLSETFGRFRILRPLGKGGMGSVYLATDTLMNRRVALKIPRLGTRNREKMLERFRREARAAAGFDHPNLCRILELDQVEGTSYLTMPYLEGRTLDDCLEPRASLSQKSVAALIRTLALAMADAHARGVVHRDLKPSNVMIVKDRGPVIVDFGLCLRVGYSDVGRDDSAKTASDDVRVTSAGSVMGTVGYMAPEQVAGDLSGMGEGSDVYSLGVILYELLTGRLPFEGPAALVMGLIMARDPEPPSTHRPDLHPRLEAICRKAMAKRVEDRYASMLEFAGALGRHLRNEEPTALLDPVVTSEHLGRMAVQRLVAQLLDGEPRPEVPRPGRSIKPPTGRSAGTLRWLAERLKTRQARIVALGIALICVFPLALDVGKLRSVWVGILGARWVSQLGGGGIVERPSVRNPGGRLGPLTGRVVQPSPSGDMPASVPRELANVRLTRASPIRWPGANVISVAFTLDGKRLLAGSDAAPYLQLYDLGQSNTPAVLQFQGHTSRVNQVTLSADGRRALSAGDDRTMRIWDVQTGMESRSPIVGLPSAVERVAISRDGKETAAACGNILFSWDLDRGGPSRMAHGHEGAITSVTFSPDGRKLLTTSVDRTARLWDAETLGQERIFKVQTAAFACGDFSPDGRQILTLCRDGTLRLWEVATGGEQSVMTSRFGKPDDLNVGDWVMFSPDGRTALTTHHLERALVFWDLEAGRSLSSSILSRPLNKAVFSPDGRQVACGENRGAIERWDVRSPGESEAEAVAPKMASPIRVSPSPAGSRPPATPPSTQVVRRPNPGVVAALPVRRAAPPGFFRLVEGEELKVISCTSGSTKPQDRRRFGNGWSGGSQFLWICEAQGAELTLAVPLEYSGMFDVWFTFTRSYDFGKVQIELDGSPLGEPLDLYSATTRPGSLRKFPKLTLEEGEHRLKVKIVGQNPNSRGFSFGLDSIRIDASR